LVEQRSHSLFLPLCFAEKVVGVEEERVGTMVGILAGILHIGNVALQGDEET
jgi:myosin heavy subunit